MDQTYDVSETETVAQELLEQLHRSALGATVVSLTGDLGAGKTTLVQAIGKAIGVGEQIVSPTFVIMKKYQTNSEKFKTLYHLDAYRIEEVGELAPLGWERIVQQPNILVIVEWGERIKNALPSGASFFTIEHQDTKRRIYAQT